MRLRTILTLLSLLALLSTTAAGFYYYYSLRESALAVARHRAAWRTETIKNQVSSFLSENMKPVRALAGLKEIRLALAEPAPHHLASANLILDHFQEALGVDVCYLMNGQGLTIASSNRRAPDSFVGQNFSFRPYFKKAVQGKPAKYLALGTTSLKRGAYYSHPVYSAPGRAPMGVVVIKAPISVLEKDIIHSSDGITLLTGPQGLIFSTNRQDWMYKTLKPLTRTHLAVLDSSRQFGQGPFEWTGLKWPGRNTAVDRKGREYLYHALNIDTYPGWKIIHLQSLQEISVSVFRPLVRSSGLVVLCLCLFAGLSVYYLFRKATREISRRKTAEDDLRKSEERYKSLYHNTPAMLYSIDPEGRIVRVNNYWSQVFGYRPEEVIGRPLTDFLTEESRRQVEKSTMPRLIQTGALKEVSHRFIKKNGQAIDVLLSVIAERDPEGAISGLLSVLIDVTERKKAEEELKQAKEKLSHYSKDLEKQVRERTREITGFLQYTPAVVYMKNTAGQYLMVNSRFEELFGWKSDEVIGKTVFDVFPKETAARIWDKDSRVLSDKQAYQSEDILSFGSEVSTYLSVRFPLLNEVGKVSRLCGISVNITDLKKAQDKLRRLSGSVLTNQEKERTAIARELHDELGQVLTALRMDAVWLKNHLEGSQPQASARAGAMCELIDSTITEVRSIATRLRPALLDDLGLIDALEWHATDFEKRTNIVCVFKKYNVPVVNEVTAIAVYRIAQEALTNAARHSRATNVDVTLKNDGQDLILSVLDNGRGFDPDNLSEQEELGLAGMRERAYLAGGKLDIQSKPGLGAEVFLRIPLELVSKQV